MKKKYIFTLVFAFFTLKNHAQQITFQKTIGGAGNDYAYDMHKGANGGYFFGALTTSFPGPGLGLTCYVIKTNDNGDTLWTVSYGDTCNQYINDICSNSDGGCIAAGGATICNNPNAGGNIARLDQNGNVMWVKGCANNEDPYPVIQSSDGNFIVGGYVTGIGAGLKDACLMKLDAVTGDTIWSKTYGGPGDNDWFYHIVQTSDGGYLAAGKTGSFGQGGLDIYLVKTDANGNLMWSKTYGTAGFDEVAFGHSLEKTSDGGYILTGSGDNTQSPNGIFLMKIDALGNMTWAKYYPGQFGHGVKQTADGGYAIMGTSNGDVVLIKTDASGNIRWNRAYGGTGAEQGLYLELANDGGYALGGYTISFGSGNKDLYFIKTDSLGHSGCNETNPVIPSTAAPFITTNPATQVFRGTNTISYIPYAHNRGGTIVSLCSTVGVEEEKNDRVSVSVYPNPFSNNATIKFSSEVQNANLNVYDILGNEVMNIKNINSSEINIDRDQMKAGMYFFRLNSGMKNSSTGKFIIE